MDKLKLCPWCGGKTVVVNRKTDYDYGKHCTNCKKSLPLSVEELNKLRKDGLI